MVVGVADGRAPRVVLSTFLTTSAEGDRLAFEPFHVAFAMTHGPQGGVSAEAAAAVAEGRKRQVALAAKGLDDIVGRLQDAKYNPVVAALLVNRAGWIGDLLEYSLGAPEHPPVAEGLAVRDALRFACGKCGIRVVEMDEKSLRDMASQQLRLSIAEIDARLKELGKTAGKPWRKEQKFACLSAWLAAADP